MIGLLVQGRVRIKIRIRLGLGLCLTLAFTIGAIVAEQNCRTFHFNAYMVNRIQNNLSTLLNYE